MLLILTTASALPADSHCVSQGGKLHSPPRAGPRKQREVSGWCLGVTVLTPRPVPFGFLHPQSTLSLVFCCSPPVLPTRGPAPVPYLPIPCSQSGQPCCCSRIAGALGLFVFKKKKKSFQDDASGYLSCRQCLG